MCVALGMQHAVRIRHIVICGLAGCTVFSTLSHKRWSCKVFRVLLKLECSREIFQKHSARPFGAELPYADGQT